MNNGAVNDEIKRHKFRKKERTERSEQKSHFQGVNFIAHYVMQKKTYAVLKLQLNVLG
jgi:hypothetical protein